MLGMVSEETARVRTVLLLLQSMRPRQWTKNLIVFTPLIFGGHLTASTASLRAVAAFASFSLISGAVYLLNDIVDLKRDRLHERKRLRPITAGDLPVNTAGVFAGLFSIFAAGTAFLLGPGFGLAALGFLALQVLYSLWLKNEVLLDVMSISAGFVIRAFAGAVVIGVAGSPWLYLCAALLALFLGLAKRRHELLALEADAHEHRFSLKHYSAPLIDSMLSAITASTIVAYSLYTFFSPTGESQGLLMLTVPFVVYGLFRYLYLIHQKNLGGSPEEILLTDGPLIISILLWLCAAIVIINLT